MQRRVGHITVTLPFSLPFLWNESFYRVLLSVDQPDRESASCVPWYPPTRRR
jgi:hypothetical protein